ncbi:uncharacterized protein LOC142982430 isoform X2 [Anticarsia gemmatalis]
MTSTSFNVGLNDNVRLSSRVLRPPGGGHTDIFGGEPEPQPQTPRRGPPASGIAAVVAQEDPKPTNGAAEPTQNGQNGATTPQEAAPAPLPGPEPKQDLPSPAKPAPEPVSQPAKVEPPKRVRVPPGGFSSGLW